MFGGVSSVNVVAAAARVDLSPPELLDLPPSTPLTSRYLCSSVQSLQHVHHRTRFGLYRGRAARRGMYPSFVGQLAPDYSSSEIREVLETLADIELARNSSPTLSLVCNLHDQLLRPCPCLPSIPHFPFDPCFVDMGPRGRQQMSRP